jgi:hypothetical protein
MSHFEFIIQAISISCPSCDEVFATPIPFKMPEMSLTFPVEADLHRLLPYGAIRACLIAICPQCQYSWWTNTFNRHYFLPVGIAESPTIDNTRKFAHAILTGRKKNFHILDRALLALNGYWCAKESNQEIDKWLSLAIQELSAALSDSSWQGNRSRYHYVLAELFRLASRFDQALNTFALVDDKANLPAALLERQKNLSIQKNNAPVLLTNQQIQEIFFPKLIIESTKNEVGQFTEKLQSESSTTNNNPFAISEKRPNSLPPKRAAKATA